MISIGAGYFVNLQNGSPTYWNLVYSSIQGGFVTHDLWSTMPVGTSFLADVVQTSSGSHSFTATTYNGGSRTFTLKTTTTSATVAGVVARATAAYSTSNTMSGFVDALGDMHWNGSTQIWKYFTDVNTNESNNVSPKVPILALGREAEGFLRKISPEVDARTAYLSHPSWPIRNYEKVTNEVRRRLQTYGQVRNR